MKFQWEEEDLVFGRRLTSSNSAENYILGYVRIAKDNVYCLLSGRDGQVNQLSVDKAKAVALLNQYQYQPLTIDPDDRVPLLS